MTDQTKDKIINAITPSTFVPIASIGAAVLLTIMVMGKLNNIENRIADLDRHYEEARRVQWTDSNMESWVDKTKIRNPGLTLPQVAEIKMANQ